MKKIQVKVDGACGINGIPHELRKYLTNSHPDWNADETAAFQLIGIATASPTYVGFSLSDTWAHVRYFAAVDTSKPFLTLRPEWNDLDPHQKTILADDWGVGFSLRYMIDHVHIADFAPTERWIKNVEFATRRSLNFPKKKNGPPKLPDYVCVDQWGYLHALECKGTQKSLSALKGQVEKGQSQIENFHKGNLPNSIRKKFRGWMVAGLFVPQAKKRSLSRLLIVDPENTPFADVIEEFGVDLILDSIRITGLSQQLAAAGFHRLATALFEGKVAKREVDFLRWRKSTNQEVNFLGQKQEAERILGQRSFRIFDRPTKNDDSPVGRIVNIESSVPESLLEKLTGLVDQAGNVDRNGVIQVLNELFPFLPEPRDDTEFDKTEYEAKCWKSGTFENSSWIESPYGIRFSSTLTQF